MYLDEVHGGNTKRESCQYDAIVLDLILGDRKSLGLEEEGQDHDQARDETKYQWCVPFHSFSPLIYSADQ